MRPRPRELCAAVALLLAAGCAAPAWPPAIRAGSACAACGMTIASARFACEQRVQGSWRTYDSIECLLREAGTTHEAFLADYDSGTLHAADSMWVVRGTLDSPMGGGLAAFLTRDQADEVAGATSGEVFTLGALIGAHERSGP